MVERTDGGVLPGLVRIKTENDFVDVAFQNSRMLFSEGRALRRHDVLHASHEAGNQIQLTFANDGKAGVENCAFGFVESEENFTLGKNQRFRRIDILRRFFIAGQNAPAETNYPALLIANWKYEPSAKTVIIISSFLFANDQSGFFYER